MNNDNTKQRLRLGYIFNMRGEPMLTIRQRILYSRLAPLRRPVKAYRLASMLGNLIDRETVSCHLEKLADLGLVTLVGTGWVAQEPSKEVAKKSFVLLKDKDRENRWHGRYASWKLPLPASQPFSGQRNSCELYAAYWLIRNIEQSDQPDWGVNRLAALLGVSRLTSRKLIMRLRDLNLLDEDDCCAANNFVLQYKDDSLNPRVDNKDDQLDTLIRRLTGKDEIKSLISQLKGRLTRQDIYKLAKETLLAHDPVAYTGDGSALVIHRLQMRVATGAAIQQSEAIQKRESQRKFDLRHARQIRNAIRDRVTATDKDKVESAEWWDDIAKMESADIALSLCRRQLTFVEMDRVIGNPSTAKTIAAIVPVVQQKTSVVLVAAPVAATVNDEEDDMEWAKEI